MKKLFSAILSTAFVFSTVANAAAMDVSLTAKSYNVKSVSKADSVIVTEDFSKYDVTDNLLEADTKKSILNDNFSTEKTRGLSGQQVFTVNNEVKIVSDPTNSNLGNVLSLKSSIDSTFPVVSCLIGKGNEHEKGRKLEVKASLFFDKDTAFGYKLSTDATNQCLDKSNMGFMSVYSAYNEWQWNRRSESIGTIAFDTDKASSWNDNSYIPAYLNFPNKTGASGKGYDDANNTGYHAKEINLPTGKWFDVKFVYDLNAKISPTQSDLGSVPVCVYIDGKKVYEGTSLIPTGKAFDTTYQGIAFSPNAFITETNKGTVAPTMYVDNIQAKYLSDKFAGDDFSGYDVTDNLLTTNTETAILGSDFSAEKSRGNGNTPTNFNNSNEVKVVSDPTNQNHGNVLSLKSSIDSTFPIVSYLNKNGNAHTSNNSLEIKANLYFDRETALGYRLSADDTNNRYLDKFNMGFMSVYSQYDKWKWNRRSVAIGTIAFDTDKASSWNDNSYIPAYLTFPNTKDASTTTYDSFQNIGKHLKDVNLPTGKWFEVKFVYDLNAKISPTNSDLGSVPVCVYIDGEKVYEGTSLIPANSAFDTTYQGIAFSPNAYMSDTNKGSLAPTMYVDDISVDYVNETNNVSFIIANSLEEAKGPMDIIAVAYDANDVVLEVKYVKGFTLDKSAELGKSISFSDNVGDVKTVRLFAWDSLENMTPYAESATVSK